MMIECGTVIESKSAQGQSVVKVNILGRETQWLPVLQQATSFKRAISPARVGAQVVVLSNRYVIGAIFNNGCPEPEGASDSAEVIEYEDGTRITYDTKAKVLNVQASGEITVNAAGVVKVDAPSIKLNDGAGVVTGAHICAFTGNPHADCSSCVTAGK
ncbi:MAG: phage baseplate assembly protein V [Vibrio sp.]